MSESSLKIGFIGAGNMGRAMIGAMIGAKVAAPAQIFVFDVNPAQTGALAEEYGVGVLSDNAAVIRACDVVIFAVKPQSIPDVLSGLKSDGVFHDPGDRKMFISIAAGIPLRTFETYIYGDGDPEKNRRMPIFRVMPNTPALVLAAMSGICANTFATEKDFQIAFALLGAMGNVIEFSESDMDAVTAVSGSGPAYCFYLAEAMIEAAENLGISPDHAAEMTMQTIKGAVKLLEHQKLPPQELRRRVTSPGGTTEAAIRVLDGRGVRQAIKDAIAAAAKRSRELSN